jgi:hypothetical protein
MPFRLILMHTPTAPGRCRQHWLMASGPAGEQRPHAVDHSDHEPEILAQDRRVMESAQLAYAREREGLEVSVEADTPTLLARRLLRMMRSGKPIGDVPPRIVRARS